jgi:metalloendopeptidase OMA1, mitochondrial
MNSPSCLQRRVPYVVLTASLLALAATIVACVTNPETGKKGFAPIPSSVMNNLGAQAYTETLQTETVVTTGRHHDIVQRVATRIAAASNQKFDWECKLVQSDVVNAFCLPGGKIVVYTGLLPVAQTEAALAFVMGHEVGHAVAEHGNQRMSQGLLVEGGLAIADIAFKNNQQHDIIMSSLGAGAQVGVLLPFSRSHESEADEMGLIYTARAGYDPAVAPAFWERMGAGGQQPPEYMSTHPSHETRSADLNKQMPRALEIYKASPVKYGVGDKL